MGRPAQRTRFRRGRDYLAVAVIVVVVAGVSTLVWQTSDLHHTSVQTSGAATSPAEPARLPHSLAQRWQRPSADTPKPVTADGTVLTGDRGTVTGRDPRTGGERWRYHRDRPLCTVGAAWQRALVAYRKNGWCSEITSLDPATGERGAQRNGDTQLGTRFVDDGNYVTTTGRSILTTFDSSLVQTMVYGDQPDAKNSDRQPRSGCRYGSVATHGDRIGVVERCGALSTQPDPSHDRFTVYEATGKDSDHPKVTSSVRLPGKHARVIAMNQRYTAVALPRPSRLLVLRVKDGSVAARYPLHVPDRAFRGDPPGRVARVSEGSRANYWYTGSSTISLAKRDFRPKWTVRHARGPGTEFAGAALVPVKDGIAAFDPENGKRSAFYAVDRHGYRGPVGMATLGPTVFEQRGKTLAALR